MSAPSRSPASSRRSATSARSTGSISASPPARSTGSSGPTARASRPRSACCSGCCAPTPARRGCSAATRGTTPSRCTAGSPTSPATSTCGRTCPAARRSTCSGGCAAGSTRPRRAELLERFELDPTKKGRAYSKGNRQKVALVAALASDVELLVLDEPTSGLDPLKEAVFQACIEEARGGGPHRAALEPHPRRGRGAVRPRDDHPRRQRRWRPARLAELRHLTRTSIAVETVQAPAGLDELPGVHDLHVEDHRARFDVDTVHLDETRAPPRRLRRAQPDEHAADARGALPAPLRRRDRMSRLRRHRARCCGSPSAASALRIPVYLVLFTLLVAETALQSEETYPTAGRARRVRRHRRGQPRA